MGQHVVNCRIARDRSAEHPGGQWVIDHHIAHPTVTGQPVRDEWPIPAADVASLSTAVATSTAAVGAWLQARIPSAWAWGMTEAGHFRQSCVDVGL